MKKSEGNGSTSSTTVRTMASQENSWNERDFWAHHDRSASRREEVTIRTGEDVPKMILKENEKYDGIPVGSAVHLSSASDSEMKDMREPSLPRLELRSRIYDLCESCSLSVDSRISILSDLVAFYEKVRHRG